MSRPPHRYSPLTKAYRCPCLTAPPMLRPQTWQPWIAMDAMAGWLFEMFEVPGLSVLIPHYGESILAPASGEVNIFHAQPRRFCVWIRLKICFVQCGHKSNWNCSESLTLSHIAGRDPKWNSRRTYGSSGIETYPSTDRDLSKENLECNLHGSWP